MKIYKYFLIFTLIWALPIHASGLFGRLTGKPQQQPTQGQTGMQGDPQQMQQQVPNQQIQQQATGGGGVFGKLKGMAGNAGVPGMGPPHPSGGPQIPPGVNSSMQGGMQQGFPQGNPPPPPPPPPSTGGVFGKLKGMAGNAGVPGMGPSHPPGSPQIPPGFNSLMQSGMQQGFPQGNPPPPFSTGGPQILPGVNSPMQGGMQQGFPQGNSPPPPPSRPSVFGKMTNLAGTVGIPVPSGLSQTVNPSMQNAPHQMLSPQMQHFSGGEPMGMVQSPGELMGNLPHPLAQPHSFQRIPSQQEFSGYPPQLMREGSTPLLAPHGSMPIHPHSVRNGAMLQNSGNLTFIFNDGKIHLYKTKTIAVPVEDDLESEEVVTSKYATNSTGPIIKAFDPGARREKNYVQTKAAVPLNVLIELRTKLARKFHEDYEPLRAGKTAEDKLNEMKEFFTRAFGYPAMGIDQAFVVPTEDASGVGFDSDVIIPQIYIAEEEKYEADMETGDPLIDSAHKRDHRQEARKEPPRKSPGTHDFLEDSHLSRPSSSQFDNDDPDIADMTGIRPETRKDILNSGRDLKPFKYDKVDEARIANWIKAFYAATTKDPSALASYNKELIEDTVYDVMRYLIAGESESGGDFAEKDEDGWANWLDRVFLKKLRAGEIQTVERKNEETISSKRGLSKESTASSFRRPSRERNSSPFETKESSLSHRRSTLSR